MVRAYLCLPPAMRDRKSPVFSQDILLFLFPNLRSKESRYSKPRSWDENKRTWDQDTREENRTRIFFVLSRQRVDDKRGKITETTLSILSSFSKLIFIESANLTILWKFFSGSFNFRICLIVTDFAADRVINFEITSKIICAFSKFANMNFYFERKVFGSNENTQKLSCQQQYIHVSFMNL